MTMKLKVISIILVLLISYQFVQAQNKNNTDSIQTSLIRKNEIKVNAVFLLAGALEVFYERNINESSSAGISVLVPFVQEDIDWNLNYYISPYYRVFFGEKYAAGFFFEGFGMLNSAERYNFVEDINKDVIDFALGIGLGGKWVTKKGLVFELNAGIGRNLFNTKEHSDSAIIGKFGFNLGYRF